MFQDEYPFSVTPYRFLNSGGKQVSSNEHSLETREFHVQFSGNFDGLLVAYSFQWSKMMYAQEIENHHIFVNSSVIYILAGLRG